MASLKNPDWMITYELQIHVAPETRWPTFSPRPPIIH